MGVSPVSLIALQKIDPSTLPQTLQFFEFLKYDTKSIREQDIIYADELLKFFKSNPKFKAAKNTKKLFDSYVDILNSCLFVKKGKDEISEIRWKKIDSFCDLLRATERSNERKVRWALYWLFCKGNTKITEKDIQSTLGEMKITNIANQLKKIQKTEYVSGLNSSFDGKKFVINHDLNDKIVLHYLADAIEESSRRSPGKLEQEILDLLDEGSYSNQEIAKTLFVDEAMVSRIINKLRKENKIVLSSFGKRGSRYFTTNCDNCPFGTTKESCRKEALSYIISAYSEDYGIDINATDFEMVEQNQALLKIKRIMTVARKDKNTKLERNVSVNLSNLFGRVVEKSLEVDSPDSKTAPVSQTKIEFSSIMEKLPVLYQLGLLKGAQSGVRLVDEILKTSMKSIKNEDRIKIRKHALQEITKFLKTVGLDKLDVD